MFPLIELPLILAHGQGRKSLGEVDEVDEKDRPPHPPRPLESILLGFRQEEKDNDERQQGQELDEGQPQDDEETNRVG